MTQVSNIKDYIENGNKVIICLDGLDGVGKDTICTALLGRLQARMEHVEYVSTPNYSSDLGKLVKEFQNGICGPFRELAPEPIAYLYTAEREANFSKLPQTTKVVLSNRSHISNYLYQLPKIRSNQNIGIRHERNTQAYRIAEFLQKQYEREFFLSPYRASYNKAITFILKMPDEVRQEILDKRVDKDGIDSDARYQKMVQDELDIAINENWGKNKKVIWESEKFDFNLVYEHEVFIIECDVWSKDKESFDECIDRNVDKIMAYLFDN